MVEEKVSQSPNEQFRMHDAVFGERRQETDIVQNFLLSTSRAYALHLQIESTTSGTFGSERENSGFSV